MTDRAEMKKEAIKRMKKLMLLPDCIEAFKKHDKVWISINEGILFELNNEQQILDAIKSFEDKYGALVYHCVKNRIGDMLVIAMFYVSGEKDEWKYDMEDIKQNYSYCYAFNITEPAFSEIGSIQFIKVNGGLKRIS